MSQIYFINLRNQISKKQFFLGNTTLEKTQATQQQVHIRVIVIKLIVKAKN